MSSPGSPQFRGSEDATFLQAVGLPDIDIGGLLLAAIIFGALGILDDVTMTQAATVTELHEASPSLSRVVLAKRAMNVGRSHISATVNTLSSPTSGPRCRSSCCSRPGARIRC